MGRQEHYIRQLKSNEIYIPSKFFFQSNAIDCSRLGEWESLLITSPSFFLLVHEFSFNLVVGEGFIYFLFYSLETPVYCLSQAELWFTHFSSLSSILGMNLFGCKFCKQNEDNSTSCDRKNFDSLLWASITVFQVLPLYESVVRLWCLSRRRGCVGVCEGQCLCMLSLCSQQAILSPLQTETYHGGCPLLTTDNSSTSDYLIHFTFTDLAEIWKDC